MYELQQVGADSFYIQCPAKIGLFRLNDREVCLIDSGNDKNAGRKARRILEENNWELKAIYNTHSHADHIGGNKYLQQQTGCKIYARGIESAFTNHPILEPALLYGGFPHGDLRHKFLMAQESCTEYLTEDKLPDGLEMIELPGHSFDMVGFRTKDGVAYIADSLSSRETLDKYRIGFLYDIAAYLDSLKKVQEMTAEIFIPAHAEPTENIAELAQYNIEKTLEIGDKIAMLCKTPMSFEQILCRLFSDYGLSMNAEQYVLVGSTVRSYLSWLKEIGRVTVEFSDNMMLWTKCRDE